MKLTKLMIAALCDAYNTTPDELMGVLVQKGEVRRTSSTHEERYTHFREMPADSKYRAVTVFSRKEDDEMWHHSYAYCMKGDHFCRSTGRKLARRKLFQGRGRRYVSKEFDYNQLAQWCGALVPAERLSEDAQAQFGPQKQAA